MALSKETRIKIFIAIDVAFFLLEIIVGYAAHSLALVADAFHMLNDVISLFVGLWAVKVATSKSSSSEYTYGWARAELLGGFVNGVFLVALCLTIVLDAIQRFVEPQEVSNPKLVLIVGGVGLAFNILGLFVFGHGHDHGDEHGHGHHDGEGHEGHTHKHTDELDAAEHGHHTHDHAKDGKTPHAHSNVPPSPARISWDNSLRRHSTPTQAGSPRPKRSSMGALLEEPNGTGDALPRPNGIKDTGESNDLAIVDSSTSTDNLRPTRRLTSSHGRTSHHSRRRSKSIDEFPVHPGAIRSDIRTKARGDLNDDDESDPSDENVVESFSDTEINTDTAITENTPLLKRPDSRQRSIPQKDHDHHAHAKKRGHSHGDSPKKDHDHRRRGFSFASINHDDHLHNKPRQKAKGGHSHDDMNIRGIFLHVLGDALGNVGVMASALIIWLTPWSFRFYFDPAISLFITLIILKSAVPLCLDTARPLLQAVPNHVSVDDIQEDINSLPGVRNCHHVHVWALTPSKLIATLDVELDFDFQGSNQQRYMTLAKEIKKCLAGFGIYSSTVQPEFCIHAEHDRLRTESGHIRNSSSSTVQTAIPATDGTTTTAAREVCDGCGNGNCLLDGSFKQCCGPPTSDDHA